MSGGSIINIIISIGLYPIVTRLFTKEQFGGLGLFTAVVGILSLAGTSLYPSGLVIPKFKRDFYALIKLSLILSLVTVVLVSLVIILFQDFFIFVFKLETIKPFLFLVPLAVALFCIRDISTNWNVRNKDFKKNAISNITSSSSLKIVQISSATIFHPSVLGLIFSSMFSVILSILTLGVKKMLIGLRVLTRISMTEVFDIGKKYKKYPLSLLPGNLINRYTADLPIYMFTAYFSPAITGAFVLANTIMAIPLKVIGSSFGSVFLQKANELYLNNPDKMSRFANRINRKMLLVGTLAFGMLFGFGDLIFSVFFGTEWTIAGKFAALFSVYFIFKLASSPMTKVFRVVGKEHYSLYVSVVLALSRILGVWIGIKSGKPLKAILYFTVANLIGYLITYAFVFKACKLPVLKLISEAVFTVIIGFIFFLFLRLGSEEYFDLPKWNQILNE